MEQLTGPQRGEFYDEAEYWAEQSVSYYRLWSEILNLDSETNLNDEEPGPAGPLLQQNRLTRVSVIIRPNFTVF